MNKNTKDEISYVDWTKKLNDVTKLIFCLSCTFLAAAILTPIFFDVSSFSFWFDSGAIKNLATSVSLTGLVMAWFLQAVNNQECGQAMTNVVRHIFPLYYINILVFFVSSAISIFFSGTEAVDRAHAFIPKETDVFISGLALISVILTIINIALLCSVILFSFEKRRTAAFSVLYALTKRKNDKMAQQSAFGKWQAEICACIDNVEMTHVEGYFRALCEVYDITCKNTSANQEPITQTLFNRHIKDVVRRIDPLVDPFYGRQVCACIMKADLSKLENRGQAERQRTLLLRLFIIALGDCVMKSERVIPDEVVAAFQQLWNCLWESQSPNNTDDEFSEFFGKCLLYYFAYVSVYFVNLYGNKIKIESDGCIAFNDSSLKQSLLEFILRFKSMKDLSKSKNPKLFEKNSRDTYFSDVKSSMSEIAYSQPISKNADKKYHLIFNCFFNDSL